MSAPDLAASLTADAAVMALEHAETLADDSYHLSIHLDATGDASLLVDTVNTIREARDRLAQAEADISSIMGDWAKAQADAGKPWAEATTGTIPGNRWELHRRKDRKEWDHDDWKRDVRAKVVSDLTAGLPADATLQHVNLETGEVTEVPLAPLLLAAIARAQEAHGSAAPKSTVLKPMGLDVGDYCTTLRGAFTITITPDAEAGATTEEDTTDD